MKPIVHDVKKSPVTDLSPLALRKTPRLLDRVARHLVLRHLASIRFGRIILNENGMETVIGTETGPGTLQIHVDLKDPRSYTALVFRGTIGAGEAYMMGYWTCDDLTQFVQLLVLNRELLDGMDQGPLKLFNPLFRAFHSQRRNTVEGSEKNIFAHYDLGNDFFELILDPTMMYSCAIFPHENASLEEASRTKIDIICRKLLLQPDHHVLEIGSGWGAFAIHAAKNYGCRVTTTTISRQQFALATERVKAAGLEDKVRVLLKDYRELTGKFDRLVSIEMIEAVGHEYYDDFFRSCSNLLKPDGKMLLQAIVISDQQYERARRSVDFIQRYIFPGSCIPAISVITDSMSRATDMRLFHLEDITAHYPPTLRHWRETMMRNRDALERLGYGEVFQRMWEFYFCYCEGGFKEHVIGDVQMLFTKPLCRRKPIPSLLE